MTAPRPHPVPPPSPARPRRRNLGRIALVAVLGLSLFGNALTLGALLRLDALRHDLLGPAAAEARYPLQTARALRRALIAHEDDLRPLFHATAEARARVVAAAAARPFDRRRVEAEMTTLRGTLDGLVRGIQAVVIDELQARAQTDTP